MCIHSALTLQRCRKQIAKLEKDLVAIQKDMIEIQDRLALLIPLNGRSSTPNSRSSTPTPPNLLRSRSTSTSSLFTSISLRDSIYLNTDLKLEDSEEEKPPQQFKTNSNAKGFLEYIPEAGSDSSDVEETKTSDRAKGFLDFIEEGEQLDIEKPETMDLINEYPQLP